MKKPYSFLIIFIFIIFESCGQNEETKPKDFEMFWEESLDILHGTKIDYEVKKDSTVGKKQWSLFKISSFNNGYFYAWVSEPIAHGKFPVKIRFSAFSEKKTKIDSIPYAWFLKENETINMVVDVRGQGLSYDYSEGEDFLTNGLSEKETFIYRGAYLDAVRSVDFVSQNPQADGNVIVSGGSQGGALSIVAAALNKKVTMCIIGFPFMTDISNYNKKNWPMIVYMHYCLQNELDYFDLIDRLSYFDMLYFADKIKVPIFIRAEEKDNITPIEGVIKFFDLINLKEKELFIEPCEGHGCSSKSQKANDLERLFIEKHIIH